MTRDDVLRMAREAGLLLTTSVREQEISYEP